MSARYFALLTNIGVAKITNAAALGIKLNITEMAVGDGGGSLPTPTPDQTSLVNERRRAPINQLSIDPLNDAQIIVEQVIPENIGGWWIKEVGLYDEDGDLVAVSNCPETYKPLLQEGSGRTQTVRMVIIVSNTSSVTVKIDPAVVLATRKYIDDKLKVHEGSRNHPAATLDDKGMIALASSLDAATGLDDKKAITSKALADTLKTNVFAENVKYKYGSVSDAIGKSFEGESGRIQKRAIVTFIFDDGFIGLYNDVAPLFERKGMRCGIAINSQLIDGGATTRVTIPMLLEMESRGHEIINHGFTHATLSADDTSDYLGESEINQGLDALLTAGLEVSGYVAASSRTADKFINTVKNRHAYGFTLAKSDSIGAEALQNDELDPYHMHRSSLYSIKLAGAKASIDAAVANGGWVVFYDHDPSQTENPASMPLADLAEVLDYCHQVGVDVMLPRQALDALHGSLIKGRRIDQVARVTARAQVGIGDNLLPDSELNAFSSLTLTPPSAWVIDKTGVTGSVGIKSYSASTLANSVTLSLDALHTASTGRVLIQNDQTTIGLPVPRVGSLCASVLLTSSTAGVNTNYDVSLGIVILRKTDNKVLISNETGKLYLDGHPRRYSITISPPSYSGGLYCRYFIRAIPKATGQAMDFSIINPKIEQGIQPTAWRRGPVFMAPVAALSAEQLSLFDAAVVPSRTRVKVPVQAPGTVRPFVSIANGEITFNETGYYALNTIIRIDDQTKDLTGIRAVLSLRIGSGGDVEQQEAAGVKGRIVCRHHTVKKFNAGQKLEYWIYHENAEALSTIADTYSYLNIAQIVKQ
ncbi:phage tail protein [Serratia fonticola]|uniref:phage tail-collar fiber domain-containing protein n=1 Tax=Serratia fonticola TaxID=47917 RepID=UPI003BB6315A